MRTQRIPRLVSMLLAAILIGCSSPDERYVELSQQSVARQAEQNQQIARQSQEVAQAAHELVQADAQARAELVAAQRSLEESLQAERSKLDRERSVFLIFQPSAAVKSLRAELRRNRIGDAIQAAVALAIRFCRPGCRAFLTGKRALENYLHPAAVAEARGIQVAFGDCDDVADLAVQAALAAYAPGVWETLAARSRRRLRNLAKHWLNTKAVDCMTAERLEERDPAGDIRRWLAMIGEFAGWL